MEPMYLSIQQKETGRRIKKLLCERGYTVKDVQSVMGFENPQAVYKWMSGKSLPSLDNFIILSRLLHTSIEDILVIDGDIFIPASNEPSIHACMDTWRLPQYAFGVFIWLFDCQAYEK
jgi:transcriptional regulator with XRE-family HTH domain